MGIKNLKTFGRGMVVLEKKDLYTIEFSSPGKLDLFTFQTCSREISIEKGRKGFNHKKIIINYRPNLIEQRGNCPATINAFDIKGRHATGKVFFEDDFTKLPAMVVCGGVTKLYNGISTCQQPKGLSESITFDTEVITKNHPGCDLGKARGQTFEFKMPDGNCTWAFFETGKPHRSHQFNVNGYSKILIRK